MMSGRQGVDTRGAVPKCYNTCHGDPSPALTTTNGIDRLPCEHSDIQPLDGQYEKGH